MSIHGILACAALVLAYPADKDREPVAAEPGFSYLYHHGDPLAQGWKMVGPGAIKEESEGVLLTSGGMGMLWFADSKFKDYTLRVDYKLTKPGDNSGVFVRFPDAPADPWDAVKAGYEIPDSTGLQVLRCRVSGRRHLRHSSSYHRRRGENGRPTEDPACES